MGAWDFISVSSWCLSVLVETKKRDKNTVNTVHVWVTVLQVVVIPKVLEQTNKLKQALLTRFPYQLFLGYVNAVFQACFHCPQLKKN